MNTKTMAAAAIVVLSAALACCGLDAGQDFVLLKDRQRIFSTKGFSFLPPQQSGWLEKFGENEIVFQKITDPAAVSFFAQAIESALSAPPFTEDELVAYVRSKKEDWGPEVGRSQIGRRRSRSRRTRSPVWATVCRLTITTPRTRATISSWCCSQSGGSVCIQRTGWRLRMSFFREAHPDLRRECLDRRGRGIREEPAVSPAKMMRPGSGDWITPSAN